MAIRKPPILPTAKPTIPANANRKPKTVPTIKTKKQVMAKNAQTPAERRAAGFKIVLPGPKRRPR